MCHPPLCTAQKKKSNCRKAELNWNKATDICMAHLDPSCRVGIFKQKNKCHSQIKLKSHLKPDPFKMLNFYTLLKLISPFYNFIANNSDMILNTSDPESCLKVPFMFQ